MTEKVKMSSRLLTDYRKITIVEKYQNYDIKAVEFIFTDGSNSTKIAKQVIKMLPAAISETLIVHGYFNLDIKTASNETSLAIRYNPENKLPANKFFEILVDVVNSVYDCLLVS